MDQSTIVIALTPQPQLVECVIFRNRTGWWR